MARYSDTDNSDVLAELETIEARRTGLAEAFAMGEIDRGSWPLARPSWTHRGMIFGTGSALLLTALDIDTLRDLWNSERVEWRNRVATTLIECITIKPAVRRRSLYDPDRAVVVWRSS